MSPRRESLPLGRTGGADRPIKEYFCLADGRTGALVNSSGGCDFWCWPDFDSPLRLGALLDPGRGGSVGVTSALGDPGSAAWESASRVITFTFPERLRIQCALVDDGAGASALVWLVEGRPGELIHISLADPSAGGGSGWAQASFGAQLGGDALPDGPGGPLALVVSAPAEHGREGLFAQLPRGGLAVWLGGLSADGVMPPHLALATRAPTEAIATTLSLIDSSISQDRRWVERLHRAYALHGLVQEGPPWAVDAVDRSLLTLRGLQGRDSGLLVAAPVTSIPQWPTSQRSWDYRYAWLRDCADAGIALVHAGAHPEAEAVALGLGKLLADRPDLPSPVSRLSGLELPPEHVVTQLRGYSDALVRVGNGAAGQAQLDTLGELARLALELENGWRCPDDLLQQVPALAQAAARRWRLPDHGIWEVRGAPQDYVHSKIMAWSALQTACELAARSRIAGPSAAWREQAAAIRAEVIERGRGPNGELVMSFQDAAADSSLLAAYLVSFIHLGEQHAESTLRRISLELGRGPLMARHATERDDLDAPCFPFIFPGLWAARVEALLGRRDAAEARLLAICELAGPAGQLSEVADPVSGALWGNYPQVQSHAALIDAALAIWPAGPQPRA